MERYGCTPRHKSHSQTIVTEIFKYMTIQLGYFFTAIFNKRNINYELRHRRTFQFRMSEVYIKELKYFDSQSIVLSSQKERHGGHKTLHASSVSSIYQILRLYKLKRATKRCDDVLCFYCPQICSQTPLGNAYREFR